MKIKITRVNLRPLKKKSDLEEISLSEVLYCGFSDDRKMFTITFRLDNQFMQDLSIQFERHHLPCVLISEPYTRNNAEIEVEDEPERR